MLYNTIKIYRKDTHYYQYGGYQFSISKDLEKELNQKWNFNFFEEIQKAIDFYHIDGNYFSEKIIYSVRKEKAIVSINISPETSIYDKTVTFNMKKIQPTCFCTLSGEPNYFSDVCEICDSHVSSDQDIIQNINNEVKNNSMDNRLDWDKKTDRIENTVQSKAEWEVRRAIYEMNSERNDGWVKDGYRQILEYIQKLLNEELKK